MTGLWRADAHLPAELNVSTWFLERHVAAGRADDLAYVCDDRGLTWGGLLELVNRAGNGLLGLGVAPGERVLIACLDGPEFLAAFWGAIRIGAVAVPVSTMMRTADYAHFLNDSGSRVLIASAAVLSEIGPAAAAAGAVEHVVVADGAPAGHLAWEDFAGRASPELRAAATSRDAPAFWLYSSGSTGAPKGAVHLHHDMIACFETYARQILDLRREDRIFSAAKLFFAYGLGNSGYFPAGAGAQAILRSARPTPLGAYETIDAHRPTLFFGVPTLYAGMLAVEDAERRFDLSSLRCCVSAGEALPPEVWRRWRDRFGIEILDGLGTTECLHIFLSNRPGQCRPGSSGLAVPGYEVALVGDDGAPVGAGEIGKLRVRGDSIMAGYWNREEKSRETLFGEWLETGDRYRQDDEGWFWFCGRNDDMLKVGGIWVSPFEVEAALTEHPRILEAAVVGREDADRLVKAAAFVVLKEPGAASPGIAEELRAFVRGRLAPYKVPRWVEVVGELPKTATGKIQRFRLRR